MSRWKFGIFETEVDLTDADFLDRLEEAQNKLDEESKAIPVVGKNSEIIRRQVECFANFFDYLFGDGTSKKMYEGKCSLDLAMRSAAEFRAFSDAEGHRVVASYEKYEVNAQGNREQRRNYNKQIRNYGKQQNRGGNKR